MITKFFSSIKELCLFLEKHILQKILISGLLLAFTGITHAQLTLYSYQSGDWNTVSTWTLDPGGTTQVGSTIPADGDNVVILTSRTVTLSSDITTLNLDITINDGGILDLADYTFTNTISVLSGQGTLRLSSSGFPAVTTNDFVGSGGGTTEYYNTTDFSLSVSQADYNNLTVNAAGVVATQVSDITINGNLHVKEGTYRINDNTAARRQLNILGNVTVDNGASITVGNGVTNSTTDPTGIIGGTAPFIDYYDQQSHRVVIYGDLYNEGTIRFTNLDFPVFDVFPPTTQGPSSGFATVYFMGATDNTLTCNGTTDFYNLVLDKGTDQTFRLTIYSSAYQNFRLFGANISGGDNPGGNPNLKKALWIRTGTLVLKGLTIIPSLSEGTCADGATPNSDFYIPANGALVVDGVDVVILSTADDYREINVAYGVSGGTGLVNGVGLSGCSSVSILGKLQINNGYFSTRESGGFITWDWTSGQFELHGGQVDAKQFRAAGVASGLASFTQTGGTLYLRGRFQRTPAQYTSVSDLKDFSVTTLNTNRITASLDGDYGTFNLNSSENVLNMSGGIMRIYDVCGTGAGQNGAFEVLSSAANINVTGGTVEMIPTTGTAPDASTYLLETNAPINNFIINRTSGTAPVQLQTYPLYIIDNFSLQSGEFDANDLDVNIEGDFSIENGTTYTTGNNWTTFNGSGTQTFTVNLAGALTLNKLKTDHLQTDQLNFAGSQGTINISDSLVILNGTLNDNGKTINVFGNVYNSGTCSGSGRIVLNNTAVQTINGDGTGVFQNLELNRPVNGTVQAVLENSCTINGELAFTGSAAGYKQLNLQNWNLSFGASASISGADASRYIISDGSMGDGGISRVYSATSTSFTFPVATAHATTNYTPATISLSAAPVSYGTITVVPVAIEHPNTTTKNISLRYFWKVRSAGFTGLQPNSVTHSYTYSQDDVVPVESDYVPARFDQTTSSWSNGTSASVDESNNIIDGTWLTNTDFIDGDYTAGDNTPVNPFGTPTTYYSRQSGLWSNAGNWSLTGHAVDDPPASPPGASDIVIIGGNDSIYLSDEIPPFPPNTSNPAASYYQLDKAVVNAASLLIETGSVLDIQNNPGCNFGIVKSHPNGNGKMRLTTRNTSFDNPSTYAFPQGDFTDFNVNGGTTEFYTINPEAGTYYILPANVSSYGSVILTPLKGSNIILPNNNFTTIYSDLICNGSDADAWLAMTWLGAYGAILPKTVHVHGNFDIRGGSFVFIYNNATPQHMIVDGDVIVHPDAGLYAWTSSTANTLSIGGSLINNGNNSVAPYGTASQIDLRRGGSGRCDLIFFGPDNASLTNTTSTPTTRLNRVTVNKGNSQSTTLTVEVGGSLDILTDNWLTMQNGTLRYVRTGNFTISTNTPFSIPATAGIYIETPSNVYIANASSNNNDMFLAGKLTLINGDVYIGPAAAPANNNDIEYYGGGLSALDIQGGNFIVNGQIRRNPSTTSGVLKYYQSGGTVIINGNNSIASNAKLEILNAGSVFNMSGGTLTIVRGGGGNTYGDLYLRPGSSTVTGGEIIFTQVPSMGPVVNSNQNYLLDASVPLYNLTITGKTAGPARDATVQLLVNPLQLNGNLELTNANSFFDANSSLDINLSIKGDFINNGTYNHHNNLTTFNAGPLNNGGAQVISGTSATDFYNLNVNPLASLTLTINDITVNNDLILSSGQLICGSYRVNLKGDLINNANYTDTQFGIILNGTSTQYISGTGTFGRLELDNTAGARISSDLTLQKDLVLTQGIFNINQYMLSLGQNSNIGGAPFGSAKMITNDGVYSNPGVRKIFGPYAGPPVSFTFPLGTGGKYTPAVLTMTSNGGVGYIRINNIDSRHPGVFSPFRVLAYYWEVESGAINGFEGDLNLMYLDADVLQAPADEANYVAARLIIPGTSWSKAAPGPGTDNVDEAGNIITFTFPAGTNNLSGEYTAGTDSDIPDDIPQYVSIANGDWSDNTIWAPTGGTSYPCPPGGPNGFIVTIDSVVTIGLSNRCFSYMTTINNRLEILSPTYGHNLGNVLGNGTLYLDNGVLPAGKFSQFLDCSYYGVLEYGGSGNYTLIADRLDEIPSLFFTGTGSRILPDKDLTICRKLKIDGPLMDNSVNNRKLTILGTMERYNTGSFSSGTGAGAIVSFAGAAVQNIGGATGNFDGVNAFNHFEINNSSGMINNGPVEIKGNLMLTDGIIQTSAANLLFVNNAAINCIIPEGGSSDSYIDGPVVKKINQGDEFLFPIGKDSYLGNKLKLQATLTGTLNWQAEYLYPNPYTALLPPLTSVNEREYWYISGVPTGSEAIINIGWDEHSSLTPLMTQNGLSDMRVAEYNGSAWSEIPTTATGDNYNGNARTNSRVVFASGDRNFTLGCINPIKPRAQFSPTGPVCGAAGIPLTFTTPFPINLNYIIDYTIDGVPQAPYTVSSLPATLPTSADGGTYQLTGFTYNNPPDPGPPAAGVVDANPVVVSPVPTPADAGTDQSLCGATSTVLSANTPLVGTGLWSIYSGTGGTVLDPTQPGSTFMGVNGNSYVLVWTISSGACQSSDSVNISFPLLPVTPGAFTQSSAAVCAGQTGVTYTVPNDPTVTYTWNYSGTGATINGTTNSVTVDFDLSATDGTLSVTATNGCGTSAPREIDITVFPVFSPGAITGETSATQCYNYDPLIMTANPSGGAGTYTYQWQSSPDGSAWTDIGGATAASYNPGAIIA
ncbi:MAG: hypothetical protein JW723_02975, partial [Bacteroidales bacterium]|nr:hypothetical protein [Bacteroidales bacterium]